MTVTGGFQLIVMHDELTKSLSLLQICDESSPVKWL